MGKARMLGQNRPFVPNRYAERGDFQCQMQVFCQDRYINCEIYRVLIEKKVKPKTNGDRIRAMPNEELDQILNRCCISYTICSGCKGCVLEKFCDVYRSSGDWLSWLRSPVEESNE